MSLPYPAILLAEDDDNDVFLLRRALLKSGLPNPLHVARDGQEAIELLDPDPFNDQALTPTPGLLLLDLKMPRLNGFDVLRWLRSQPALQSLPVVILTSSSLESDMQQATQLGAAAYKLKPATTEDLVALLHELAARWLSLPPVPSSRPPPPRPLHP